MCPQYIFIPAKSPEDWNGLAASENHWEQGFSARTLAYCWHSSKEFPPEISAAFRKSSISAFHRITPLLILPEYKTQLKGQGFPSQSDVFALAKAEDNQLITITVEGKAHEKEEFDDPLGTWKTATGEFTTNKKTRLDDLQEQLGLDEIPDHVHYQLIHRSASAIKEAKRFNAKYAVMLVHAFRLLPTRFDEYATFIRLFDKKAIQNELCYLNTISDIQLFSAWVDGDERFLKS